MDAEQNQPVSSAEQVEPPRGADPLTLDDKTRLKLPTAFQRYLTGLKETQVFITTIDLRTARIYPLSVWKRNEEILERYRNNPQARQNVQFMAQHYGADSDVDPSGRVVLSPQLRERLGFQPKGKVWLVYSNKAFTLYTDAEYQKQLQLREENLLRDVEVIQRETDFV